MMVEVPMKHSDVESDDNTDTNSPNSNYVDDMASFPSTSDFQRESAPSPDAADHLGAGDAEDLEQPPADDETDITANRRLINIGNSCYMNSALQALATCPEFARRANRLAEMDGEDGVQIVMNRHGRICEDVPYFLRRLARRHWDDFRNPLIYLRQISERDLREYRRSFSRLANEFATPGQKDVHEYLMVLLGFFDDLVTKFMVIPPAHRRSLRNPTETFNVNLELCTICEKCQKKTFATESRTDLMLGIRRGTDIQTLLSEVFTWTKLQKRCDSETCKQQEVTCYQGTRIVGFPQYLIVTLPRFSCSGFVGKNQSLVEPNFEIDLEELANYSEYTECTESLQKKPDKSFKPLNKIEDVQPYLDNFVANYDERNVEYHLSSFEPCETESFRPGKLIRLENPDETLFRSISFWLMGDESAANLEFQAATCELLETNFELFEEHPDMEVAAVATLLNIDIHLFTNDKWRCVRPLEEVEPQFAKRKSSIYLAVEGELYSPVRSVIEDGVRKRRCSDEEEVVLRKRMKFEWAEPANYRIPSRAGYTMTAAICHQGSGPTCGHYVAYVKDERSEEWAYCSDEHVRLVGEQRSRMRRDLSTDGYVFFYRKNTAY